MDYEQLLKKARNELPESVFHAERFEIPKVRGHLQGSRTVLGNLTQIASQLRRPVDHLFKFILRELATPGTRTNSGHILGSKIPASKVNEKIEQYARAFVICSDCGKPDTSLEKVKNVTYMKCSACGVRKSIKSKI